MSETSEKIQNEEEIMKEEKDQETELDPQVFAAFKKKRLIFRLFMILSFAWLIGMGIVVMIVDSALLGVIVGVVFVGALVGSIVYGFSSSAVFCPHCQKLLGAEIRTCSNCGNSLL